MNVSSFKEMSHDARRPAAAWLSSLALLVAAQRLAGRTGAALIGFTAVASAVAFAAYHLVRA